VLVAVTEAAANAIEHAYGPVDAAFDVQAEAGDDGEVTVVVADQGRWRPPRGHNRGRGTLLMQELMDHFEVTSGEEGTVVTMRRQVTREEAPV
jgi:anti-sigma regulatory factor (Ser/Thr protein kinase)